MLVALTHAKRVISLVAQKSDRAILFYSSGKDSIALLDLMAPHFKEIVLVYMYLVPGLQHVDKYLNYSRAKYPNVTVKQVPHWNLSYIQAYGMFTEPKENIKLLKLKHIDAAIREETGIEYVFYGMKKADGMSRNIMLSRYDLHALSTTGKVYPLALWTKADVLQYIRSRGLPLPIEYSKGKASQGLGLNIDCFLYLQKNYPADLTRILSAYPLAEKILIDHQNRQTC